MQFTTSVNNEETSFPTVIAAITFFTASFLLSCETRKREVRFPCPLAYNFQKHGNKREGKTSKKTCPQTQNTETAISILSLVNQNIHKSYHYNNAIH